MIVSALIVFIRQHQCSHITLPFKVLSAKDTAKKKLQNTMNIIVYQFTNVDMTTAKAPYV